MRNLPKHSFRSRFLHFRPVLRMFVKEIKVGIRPLVMKGQEMYFTHLYFDNNILQGKEFTDIDELAQIAREYDLPVHVYGWYRHPDGPLYSQFEDTEILIMPDVANEELTALRDLLNRTLLNFTGGLLERVKEPHERTVYEMPNRRERRWNVQR